MPDPDQPNGDASRFVSRGGLKLAHALTEFGIDPTGFTCADLGCSTGGFTDCLLQHGAAKVYAVDTAYGQLAWKLRSDERVTVMERTNALHADPVEPVDLVVVDLGWTVQAKLLPVALSWLKPGGSIVTLVKPHYEIGRAEFDRLAVQGVLPDDVAERVAAETIAGMGELGVRVLGSTRSPIRGGKKASTGNLEWLAWCAPR